MTPPRPVAAAYREFLAARDTLSREGAKNTRRDDLRAPVRDLHRPIWEAALAALTAYHHPLNWDDRRPVEPLPPEIAHQLATALGELVGGKMPTTWKVVAKASRPTTPGLMADIAAAVRYVRAAKARVILDPKHAASVAAAFKVASTVVHRWNRETPILPAIPDAGEETQGETIRIGMICAGQHYQAFKATKRHPRGV